MISVLAVQSVFVVAWVEKSGGGIVIVDTIIRAPDDDVGASVFNGWPVPEDDVTCGAEFDTAGCTDMEVKLW